MPSGLSYTLVSNALRARPRGLALALAQALGPSSLADSILYYLFLMRIQAVGLDPCGLS